MNEHRFTSLSQGGCGPRPWNPLFVPVDRYRPAAFAHLMSASKTGVVSASTDDFRRSSATMESEPLPADAPLPENANRISPWFLGLGTLILLCGIVGWSIWSEWRSSDLLAKAQEFTRQRDWDGAESMLRLRAFYKRENDEVARLRIYVAIQRGDDDLAARLLENIPDRAEIAGTAYMFRGIALFRQLHLGAAEIAFKNCLKIKTIEPEAFRQLAAIYALQRRDADFDAMLWRIGNSNHFEEKFDALRWLAPGAVFAPKYLMPADLDEFQILVKAHENEPENAPTRAALAELYRLRGDMSNARALIDPWLADHPDDIGCWLTRQACRMDDGDGDLPLFASTWSQAPTGAENLARFWLLQGQWREHQQSWDHARRCYEQALKLSPRAVEPRNHLAQILRVQGETAGAEELTRAIESAHDLAAVFLSEAPNNVTLSNIAAWSALCTQAQRPREAEAWLAFAKEFGYIIKQNPPFPPRHRRSSGEGRTNR